MKSYLWQLYDERGKPIPGVGAMKQEVVLKGILHATAHVWLWRENKHHKEVLLQRRARTKINWPGLLDKSAGGHVRLGETPLDAAVRKVRDELGLTVAPEELRAVGTVRWKARIAHNELIENELQYLYIAEAKSAPQLNIGEQVEDIEWKSLGRFRQDLEKSGSHFVPYGQDYFSFILNALEAAAPYRIAEV